MAISLVQSNTNQVGTGMGTTATCAFTTANTTAGNLLIVTVATTTASLPTISDDKGNTWQTAATKVQGASQINIFYAENCSGGSKPTITITKDMSAACSILVSEWSGALSVGSLDGTGVNSGTTTAINYTPTVSVANELYVGVLHLVSNVTGLAELSATIAPTNLYSQTDLNKASQDAMYFINTTSVSNQAVSWSWTSSQASALVVATFKPAAAVVDGSEIIAARHMIYQP